MAAILPRKRWVNDDCKMKYKTIDDDDDSNYGRPSNCISYVNSLAPGRS